jgi:hypothetical protein
MIDIYEAGLWFDRSRWQGTLVRIAALLRYGKRQQSRKAAGASQSNA